MPAIKINQNKILGLVLLLFWLLASVVMIIGGEPIGWIQLVGLALIFLIGFVGKFQKFQNDNVQISDWGIKRVIGEKTEQVSWENLAEVIVQTTSKGPSEDVFFLLCGEDGKGVVVTHTKALEIGLLEALHKRLENFDNRSFVVAMGSVTNQSFVVWRRHET